MGKKKLILDLNIIVSGFGWEGQERKVLEACLEKKFLCFFSKPLFEHLKKVFKYEKLKFLKTKRRPFVSLISRNFKLVKTTQEVNIIKEDPDDNRVLECALASQADYIITGDKHLLKLKEFQGISILKTTEFIQKELS